jgi:hypothetical protein
MTEQPEEQPSGTVVFQCQKCGADMPPMDSELAKIAMSTGGVVLAHEVCPGEEPKDEGRLFGVRVQVIEIRDHGDGDDETEELIRFAVDLRAADLDAAMRPLALALGEKWAVAEKQAKLADSPPVPS